MYANQTFFDIKNTIVIFECQRKNKLKTNESILNPDTVLEILHDLVSGSAPICADTFMFTSLRAIVYFIKLNLMSMCLSFTMIFRDPGAQNSSFTITKTVTRSILTVAPTSFPRTL